MPKFFQLPKSGKLARIFGRTQSKTVEHAPSILVYGGVVGLVTAGVIAGKSSYKANKVMISFKCEKANIEEAKKELAGKKDEEGNDLYPEKDQLHDTVMLYERLVFGMIKAYALPIALGAFSAYCVLKGHHMTLKRVAALGVAYTKLKESYDAYKETVDEVVDEKQAEKIDEKLKEKKQIMVFNRFFDERSAVWKNDYESNMMFLNYQQNYFNDTLITKGVVFLNDVYSVLDLPLTNEGSVIGWRVTREQVGSQDYEKIDFGLNRLEAGEAVMNLEFNPHGYVYGYLSTEERIREDEKNRRLADRMGGDE